MLGLVFAAMPRPRLPVPAAPAVQRDVVLAWKATSKPPPGKPVMLGLVPAAMPRPRLPPPADPAVHRDVVLAWNAASKPPPPPPPALNAAVPLGVPRPVGPS